MALPLRPDEEERLAVLREHEILDTPPEREYDDITLLASQICGTPISLISFVDEDRQWFKSRVGLEEPETQRDDGFCTYAILNPGETLIVGDAAKDERFASNSLVVGGPRIRFYAGAPLLSKENLALGTLSVLDNQPRSLTERQVEALQALARQLSMRLELRRTTRLLQKANEELKNLSLTDDLTGLYNRRGFFLHAEQQVRQHRSRETEHSMWLMLGDLDGLKQINDTYGHDEGSAAICAAAEILRKTLREADIIARIGGDEFAALILNTLDDVAERLPDRIESNFQAYNHESGKPYDFGISVGLVKVLRDDKTPVNEILDQADRAMYAAKRRRRSVLR
ncbi:MAG: sensor domain-containing diguanylate cyclase [Acidobacteriota bacterium]